jgi:hypothetical protein
MNLIRSSSVQMTPPTINIITAELAGDFRIRLKFDDDTEQTVDFKPFLTHAPHPDIRAWLDPVRFATFRVKYGELIWGDYDLCFPAIDLRRNQIEHHSSFENANAVSKVWNHFNEQCGSFSDDHTIL